MKNNELPPIDFSNLWITYLNDTIKFPAISDLSDESFEEVMPNDEHSFKDPQG